MPFSSPEDEYRWLNARLDTLQVQMGNKQREIDTMQAEYDRHAERMQEVFGIVHARRYQCG